MLGCWVAAASGLAVTLEERVVVREIEVTS